MMRPGLPRPWRRRSPDVAAGLPDAADELAYLLLEEARLRSRAIWERAQGDPAASVLHDVHRELGLAAYLACSEVSSERRQERRARARRLASEPVTDSLRALGHTMQAAAEILAPPSLQVELTSHLQQAAVHLATAHRLVDRLRSASPREHRRHRLGHPAG